MKESVQLTYLIMSLSLLGLMMLTAGQSLKMPDRRDRSQLIAGFAIVTTTIVVGLIGAIL